MQRDMEGLWAADQAVNKGEDGFICSDSSTYISPRQADEISLHTARIVDTASFLLDAMLINICCSITLKLI